MTVPGFIKSVLYLPIAAFKGIGSLAYTLFITFPYYLFSNLASGIGYVFSWPIAGFKYLGSLGLSVLRPVGAFVASVLGPVVAKYLEFITAFNASVGTFFAPLLARAPWLATLFQPLARFLPLFKVAQGFLMLAAFPYVAAAAAGATMFVVSAGIRAVSNVITSARVYFFDNSDGPSVWRVMKDLRTKLGDIYGSRSSVGAKAVKMAFHTIASFAFWAPLSALSRLAFVGYMATIENMFDSFKFGLNTARKSVAETLEFPLFKMIRNASSGGVFRENVPEPETTAETVERLVREVGPLVQGQKDVVNVLGLTVVPEVPAAVGVQGRARAVRSELRSKVNGAENALRDLKTGLNYKTDEIPDPLPGNPNNKRKVFFLDRLEGIENGQNSLRDDVNDLNTTVNAAGELTRDTLAAMAHEGHSYQRSIQIPKQLAEGEVLATGQEHPTINVDVRVFNPTAFGRFKELAAGFAQLFPVPSVVPPVALTPPPAPPAPGPNP